MNNQDYYHKRMYVDESGNISKNGTKYLVLTAICLEDNKKVTKIIKGIKKKLSKIRSGANWLRKNKGELKFAKFPNLKLKKELIEKISKLDIDISCLVIEKNESKIFYEEKRNILFMMFENHIEKKHKFPFKAILDNDFLCLKKGGYLFLREYDNLNQNGELINSSSQIIFSEFIGGDNNFIKIDETDSKTNYGLQLADFISGAIFREYELGDKTFTDVIKKNNKINIKIKKVLQNPLYSSVSSI